MALRDAITGILCREDLDAYTWPVAWQGFVGPEERAEQENDRADLIAECREAFDEGGDVWAVEVKDGELVATLDHDALTAAMDAGDYIPRGIAYR